jgi:hypothetical protein
MTVKSAMVAEIAAEATVKSMPPSVPEETAFAMESACTMVPTSERFIAEYAKTRSVEFLHPRMESRASRLMGKPVESKAMSAVEIGSVVSPEMKAAYRRDNTLPRAPILGERLTRACQHHQESGNQ